MSKEVLSKSPLFRDLSPGLLQSIARLCRREIHGPGAELFEAGQPARELYVLERGKVALIVRTEAREEVILATVSAAGEVFGWSALVEPRVLTAGAQCLAESTLLALDARELESLLDAHPQEGLRFMRRFASLIAKRLKDTQSRLIGSIS